MAAAEEIYSSKLTSELIDKQKKITLLSNPIVNDKIEINNKEGYLYIDEFSKFNNLYYFLRSKQQLLSLKEMLEFKETNTFTYILFQVTHPETGEISYDFRARPVYSKFESFAKHLTIYIVRLYELFGIDIALESYRNVIYNDLYSNLGIVSAGEIKVRTKSYFEFNFSSGTFMLNRLTSQRNYDHDAELSRHYAVQFEGIIKNYILDFLNLDTF